METIFFQNGGIIPQTPLNMGNDRNMTPICLGKGKRVPLHLFPDQSVKIMKRLQHSSTCMLSGLMGLLFVGLTARCTSQSTDTVARLDGSTIPKDSITHKLETWMQAEKVIGAEVALFNANSAVYEKPLGLADVEQKKPFNTNTNIYGASLSKAVFGVLTLKLVEQGVIDLDTPLESYLPKKIYEYTPQTRWHDDYSDLKTDSLYHKITARMCLSQTSGLPNWRFFEDDQKLKVHRIPGTEYEYSGEGFVYLQVVLEKITGKGLEELAQELLFKPLGMKDTAYEWKSRFEADYSNGYAADGSSMGKDTDNEPRAASTLETTLHDYTLFMSAVLQQKLLSKASYAEMFAIQTPVHPLSEFMDAAQFPKGSYADMELGYGLGWGVMQTPYGKAVFKCGHGSGFMHYSILFPELGKGMLIMTNSDNSEPMIQKLAGYALGDQILWKLLGVIPYV